MIPAAQPSGHLQDGPTVSRPTYRLIQVLRAVAALMVVFHHETEMMWDRLRVPTLGHNWVNGGAGVDIFFVISGFVMAISSAPLVSTPHPARTFLARRLERVVPMYWLLTLLKIALVLAHPSDSVNGLGGWQHVVGSFLFLPDLKTGTPVLLVGWTLVFEMAFYALFALALALRVRALAFVAPVLIAITLWCRFSGPGINIWTRTISHFGRQSLVLEFLFGMILALALPWLKRLPLWLGVILALAPWYSLCTWTWPNDSNWRALQWGLLALSIVAGALALESHIGRFTPKWMLELGDASYSIYLTHGFVVPLCATLLLQMPHAVLGARAALLIGMLVLCALVGDAVYRLVELPITRWFKGRRRTAIPAVG